MAADPVPASRQPLDPPPSAVRRALLRTFGPPPISGDVDAGDPGLTGPGSASWRVIGEPSAIAGGIRGLLVQLAHPLAMAGVHDHSAFRTDPLGRLQRTTAWVSATTFGSTSEAFAVTRRVRGAHRRIKGVAPDGRRYTATDPELLTWVSIALTSSFLTAYRLWAPRPLPDEDMFVAEQARIAALLDPRVDLAAIDRDPEARRQLREGALTLPMIESGELPVTVAELDARLADFVSDLGVNHQSREAIRFLQHPPLSRGALVGYRLLLGGAFASLHFDVARALEVHWPSPVRRAAISATGATIAALRLSAGPSPTQLAATKRLHTPRATQ